MVDWWCYLHTPRPEDPVKIARRQHWGHDALIACQQLIAQEKVQATGLGNDQSPGLYDRGIEPTPSNSIGIRKGWLGR